MTPPNFIIIGLQIRKLHRGDRPPRPCQILKSPACLGLKYSIKLTKISGQNIDQEDKLEVTKFQTDWVLFVGKAGKNPKSGGVHALMIVREGVSGQGDFLFTKYEN